MQSSEAGGASMQPDRKPVAPGQPAALKKGLLDGITMMSGTVTFSAAGGVSLHVDITPMGATMDSGPSVAGQAASTTPGDSAFTAATRNNPRNPNGTSISDSIDASGTTAGLANATAGGNYTAAIRYSSGGTVTRKATIQNVQFNRSYPNLSFS